MSARRVPSIEVADYHDEIVQHERTRSDDYHPATANEPRRVLTWNGEILGGSNNGEGRSDWGYRPNVTVHTAVTGSGYAYGTSVAACNGSLELSYNAEMSSLVEISTVDEKLLCQRPGCRAARTQASAPVPARATTARPEGTRLPGDPTANGYVPSIGEHVFCYRPADGETRCGVVIENHAGLFLDSCHNGRRVLTAACWNVQPMAPTNTCRTTGTQTPPTEGDRMT